MILEVLTDSREILDDRNTQLLQMIRRTHTGEHEKLRAGNRARGKDDLFVGPDDFPLAIVVDENNALRDAVFDEDLLDQKVLHDLEVPPGHCGLEVGGCGCDANAVLLCDLEGAGAALGPVPVVEIRVFLDARVLACVDKSAADGVEGLEVADAEGPRGAVELIRSAAVLLGLLEVGDDVFGAPSICAKLVLPPEVVEGVAAVVEHDGNGVGAAEDLAAGEVDAAAVECGFGVGVIGPVPLGAREVGEAEGNVEADVVGGFAGFEEADRGVGGFGETVREDASSRATSDDHIVMHAPVIGDRSGRGGRGNGRVHNGTPRRVHVEGRDVARGGSEPRGGGAAGGDERGGQRGRRDGRAGRDKGRGRGRHGV
mmetsp:Transcript_19699/g.52393  ORF Transcript_19699/g.52393 Transcript_19699/m.52393 type:complete len:370 (+) Transcript_19699:990-2099(+)